MSFEEEIIRIRNKLFKMSHDNTTCRDEALDLLRTVQKMPMSADLLAKTRLGLSVNTFRKSSSDFEIVCLARGILKGWRKLIPADINNDHIFSPTTDEKEIQTDADDVKTPSSEITSDDPARLKCRELIENTLILYASVLKDCTCPKKLAAQLENVIYQQHKNSINFCKNCLQQKERKACSEKEESILREQEKLLDALNLAQSQISEIQDSQTPWNIFTQGLQQLCVSEKRARQQNIEFMAWKKGCI